MYVWTKEAEAKAKNLGLEERKEGQIANCGLDEVSGQIAQAWLKKGYIKIK